MFTKVEVLEMSDFPKDGWNEFLKRYSDQSTVFHTQEWMKTLQEAHGYIPKYLTAMNDDDSFVAVMPFMIDTRYGIKNYLSMPYDTYGGVLGDLGSSIALEHRTCLIHEFLNLPGIGVRYYIDYSHLLQNGDVVSTEEMDISANIDDIWKDMHKANRTAIKSAWKHNVMIRDITTSISTFDKVPQVLVDSIIRNMIPSGYCKIYTATIGEEIVASSIFFIYGNMTMYWANTTTELGRKTNANYLLLWTAIQYAKERGCTIFNFGASPKNANSLVKFKQSWGTTSHKYIKHQKVPILLYPLYKLREVLRG